MLSSKSIWLIFVAVVVGIAALAYSYSSQIASSPEPASAILNSESKQPALAPPTGNVDDLAEEITENLASESALITEADDEAALADEEIKALDELGQSYDENEF
jgi:hypothetical protein